jgi:hypothetical protein
VLVLGPSILSAQEKTEKEGPPLPLHTIEGSGGLVLTPMAYLVNPGPEGEVFGQPSFSAQYVMVGGKDLQVFAVTWTLWNRLEVGYAFNRFGLNDLNDDLRDAGLFTNVDEIYLHHFNARLNVLRETENIPAVTLGVHYKYNQDIDNLNRDINDTLETIDYEDNDGFDFTLTASKTVTSLPRPVIVSAGARATRASQFGLLGFTDDYVVNFEGGLAMLVTDRLVLGTEYRQKQETLGEINDLIAHDDSWWDIHAAYILNNNSSVYAVAGDAGGVANHSDEMFYGMVFKYEF